MASASFRSSMGAVRAGEQGSPCRKNFLFGCGQSDSAISGFIDLDQLRASAAVCASHLSVMGKHIERRTAKLDQNAVRQAGFLRNTGSMSASAAAEIYPMQKTQSQSPLGNPQESATLTQPD